MGNFNEDFIRSQTADSRAVNSNKAQCRLQKTRNRELFYEKLLKSLEARLTF